MEWCVRLNQKRSRPEQWHSSRGATLWMLPSHARWCKPQYIHKCAALPVLVRCIYTLRSRINTIASTFTVGLLLPLERTCGKTSSSPRLKMDLVLSWKVVLTTWAINRSPPRAQSRRLLKRFKPTGISPLANCCNPRLNIVKRASPSVLKWRATGIWSNQRGVSHTSSGSGAFRQRPGFTPRRTVPSTRRGRF